LNGDTLNVSGRAPAFWIVRAESVAPALAGVGSVDFSRVAPGLPADMEAIAAEIERSHAFFAPGADSLDRSALAATALVAIKLRELLDAATTIRYNVSLTVVGRADPSGAESDNLALSRRRAFAVRDRLVSLGISAARITTDAIGNNDPLPADSPAERARLNRSASFVVRAQPSASVSGAERAR
jgi:outer membrane protein OmpA-like peptidoglycan-associated protein